MPGSIRCLSLYGDFTSWLLVLPLLLTSTAKSGLGELAAGSYQADASLDEAIRFGSKGQIADTKRTLLVIINNRKAKQEDRQTASIFLADILVSEGDYKLAQRYLRLNERVDQGSAYIYKDVKIRADFLSKYGRYSTNDTQNLRLLKERLKLALKAPKYENASKIAISILRTPIILGGDWGIGHAQALMGLAAVWAKKGKASQFKAASDSYLALIAASPAPLPIGASRELYRRDMLQLKERVGMSPVSPTSYSPPKDPYWPSSTSPADWRLLGIDSEDALLIKEYIAQCRSTGADTVLVVWRGHILSEWYSNRYSGQPLNTASSTKSIAGLLEYMLEDERKVSWQDLVGKYLPSWRTGLRGKVKVDDLLGMTSGITHLFDMDDQLGDAQIPDMNEFVVRTMEPTEEPGERFFYANYNAQLLSPILESAAGMPLAQYARQRLFNPLGFPPESGLAVDAKGHAVLFGGAKVRPREFARLGYLVSNDGAWGAHNLIASGLVDRFEVPGMANDNYYAQLWWHRRKPIPSLSMLGSLGNCCYVYPSAKLVVVRQQMWDWKLYDKYDEEQDYRLMNRLAMNLAKHAPPRAMK